MPAPTQRVESVPALPALRTKADRPARHPRRQPGRATRAPTGSPAPGRAPRPRRPGGRQSCAATGASRARSRCRTGRGSPRLAPRRRARPRGRRPRGRREAHTSRLGNRVLGALAGRASLRDWQLDLLRSAFHERPELPRLLADHVAVPHPLVDAARPISSDADDRGHADDPRPPALPRARDATATLPPSERAGSASRRPPAPGSAWVPQTRRRPSPWPRAGGFAARRGAPVRRPA
jgi:hypothetical protein